MTPRWQGPYTIHEALGKGVYKIRNPQTEKLLMQDSSQPVSFEGVS